MGVFGFNLKDLACRLLFIFLTGIRALSLILPLSLPLQIEQRRTFCDKENRPWDPNIGIYAVSSQWYGWS
jgi:hypothetical protein